MLREGEGEGVGWEGRKGVGLLLCEMKEKEDGLARGVWI